MMLAGGMQETDLMAVVGWRSRDIVARYAASTRAERASARPSARSVRWNRLADKRSSQGRNATSAGGGAEQILPGGRGSEPVRGTRSSGQAALLADPEDREVAASVALAGRHRLKIV